MTIEISLIQRDKITGKERKVEKSFDDASALADWYSKQPTRKSQREDRKQYFRKMDKLVKEVFGEGRANVSE